MLLILVNVILFLHIIIIAVFGTTPSGLKLYKEQDWAEMCFCRSNYQHQKSLILVSFQTLNASVVFFTNHKSCFNGRSGFVLSIARCAINVVSILICYVLDFL